MTKSGSHYLPVKFQCLGPCQYLSPIMLFYLCVLLLTPHQPDDVTSDRDNTGPLWSGVKYITLPDSYCVPGMSVSWPKLISA